MLDINFKYSRYQAIKLPEDVNMTTKWLDVLFWLYVSISMLNSLSEIAIKSEYSLRNIQSGPFPA